MVTVDMSNFKAQLEELERLNRERTQGEWRYQGRVAGKFAVIMTGEVGPRAWTPGRFICSSRAVKNGREANNFESNFYFIAAAANLVGPMLEEILVLREALKNSNLFTGSAERDRGQYRRALRKIQSITDKALAFTPEEK